MHLRYAPQVKGIFEAAGKAAALGSLEENMEEDDEELEEEEAGGDDGGLSDLMSKAGLL